MPIPSVQGTLFALSLLVFTGLFSTNSISESKDTFYQVELIVFKHTVTQRVEEVFIPSDDELTFPEPVVLLPELASSGKEPVTEPELTERFENKLSRRPFSHLASALTRLKRSSRYQVLFAKSWVQPINYKESHPYVVVTGGKTVSGLPELNGAVKLSVGRYLHLQAKLWLIDFAPGITDIVKVDDILLEPESIDWLWPIPPKPPFDEDQTDTTGPLLADFTIPTEFANDTPFGFEAPQQAYTRDISRISLIDNSTRLKSRDIHYVDHPLFGLIIKITPMPTAGQAEQ